MQLSFEHRHVGDVTVITCRSRIVLGEEADALLKQIDDLLPVNSRILLHLGEVDFIGGCRRTAWSYCRRNFRRTKRAKRARR